MTPDYMVLNIGKSEQTYSYKEEIISKEEVVYNKEKDYYTAKFNQYFQNDDKDNLIKDIQDHTSEFFEKHNRESNIGTIMDTLSKMI